MSMFLSSLFEIFRWVIMRKIITTTILTFTLFLNVVNAAEDSDYSKCGIYDVFGTVKLKQGQVFLDFKKGSSKRISLKVLDAPQSLKLLESFSVKLKLDVQKITGRNLEGKYVRSAEEIQVFPGSDPATKVQLEKEEECKHSLSNKINMQSEPESESEKLIRSSARHRKEVY